MGYLFQVEADVVYVCKVVIALWPKCFKSTMFTSSGPVDLFLAFCIACFGSCSELVICVFYSFFFLSMTVIVVQRRVFCCVSELFVEALYFL